jgi:hypothetical protein
LGISKAALSSISAFFFVDIMFNCFFFLLLLYAKKHHKFYLPQTLQTDGKNGEIAKGIRRTVAEARIMSKNCKRF